jgi:hypothetical protein
MFVHFATYISQARLSSLRLHYCVHLRDGGLSSKYIVAVIPLRGNFEHSTQRRNLNLFGYSR